MDVDQLPEDVLLEILNYLPFKDRVRTGRISRRFNRLSIKSTRKMRWLHLDENTTDDLIGYMASTESFASLLESCSLTLESIQVSSKINTWILNTLSEFVYPKLAHLKIALYRFPSATDRRAQLASKICIDLINRNCGIKSLTLIMHQGVKVLFPIKNVLENLKILKIDSGKDVQKCAANDLDGFLRSFVDRVPNLEYLTIRNVYSIDRFGLSESVFKCSMAAVDDLLASTPNLKNLHIRLPRLSDAWPKTLDYFWNLSELKSLILKILKYGSSFLFISANFVEEIAESFPKLTRLILPRVTESAKTISSLTKMKRLRELRMSAFEIEPESLLEVIDSCPELSMLLIRGLKESKINDFLESISDDRPGKLTVSLSSPWRLAEMNMILEKIFKEKGVVKIRKLEEDDEM